MFGTVSRWCEVKGYDARSAGFAYLLSLGEMPPGEHGQKTRNVKMSKETPDKLVKNQRALAGRVSWCRAEMT